MSAPHKGLKIDEYQISSFCQSGNCGHCVAVKRDGDTISVLDTKNPNHALSFTKAEWSAFIEGVKNGEFGE